VTRVIIHQTLVVTWTGHPGLQPPSPSTPPRPLTLLTFDTVSTAIIISAK